jgi:hypothetical protein
MLKGEPPYENLAAQESALEIPACIHTGDPKPPRPREVHRASSTSGRTRVHRGSAHRILFVDASVEGGIVVSGCNGYLTPLSPGFAIEAIAGSQPQQKDTSASDAVQQKAENCTVCTATTGRIYEAFRQNGALTSTHRHVGADVTSRRLGEVSACGASTMINLRIRVRRSLQVPVVSPMPCWQETMIGSASDL